MDKAAIVAKAVEGPITSMVSATALQLHPHCILILDEAAASELKESEYHRQVFENEPEWAPFRDASFPPANGRVNGVAHPDRDDEPRPTLL
jgi:hypothetical protein